MKYLKLKQEKPITVTMLGVLLMGLGLFSFTTLIQFLVLNMLGIIVLGYRISYRITKEFMNTKEFSLLGIKLWSSKLSIQFPEYISVFGANYSKSNDWGPVSALGTQSETDKVVVTLFSANEKFTVYRSGKYEKSKHIAEQLSTLLDVELVDHLK